MNKAIQARQIGLARNQFIELADDLSILTIMSHPRYPSEDGVLVEYKGKVMAKERPRQGKFGTYTPAKTREFEAAVKAVGKDTMLAAGIARYTRPIAAHLSVYEAVPQSWGKYKKHLAMAGLLLPDRRDLDNQIKAIMDALNEVCFVDDCQLSQLTAVRRFSEDEGFRLSLFPIGISYSDAITLENMIKQQGK